MAASALKELPEHVDLMLPLPESSDDDIMVPLPDWSDDDTKDTDDSLQEDVPLPESTGDDIMLPLSDWSDDANKDIDNPLQEETFTDSAPKESTNSSSVDVPNENHSEGASLMQEANSGDPLQVHIVRRWGQTLADACDTTPVSKELCFAYGLEMRRRLVEQWSGGSLHLDRDFLVEGNWHWVPPGCSIQTIGHDWAVHWNDGFGHNNGHYRKICHGNYRSHHPTRVIRVNGGIFWETDGTRHHVPTCHMCNRNFCNSQWYQEVDQHYLNSLTPGPTFHCGILSG